MSGIDLANSPTYQLWLATNAWQRSIRRVLDPIGLTHVQFIVLAFVDRLSASGEPVSQALVCRMAAIDANMTSEVVKLLEAKALLDRSVHPSDRRAHALSLTPGGKALLDQARALVKPRSEAFFAPLGSDTEKLTALLRALTDSGAE